MKLKDYLAAEGLTQQEFADRLTAVLARRSTKTARRIFKQQVQQWCAGSRRPLSNAIALAIYEATGGQVTPNDSFDLPPATAEASDGGGGA